MVKNLIQKLLIVFGFLGVLGNQVFAEVSCSKAEPGIRAGYDCEWKNIWIHLAGNNDSRNHFFRKYQESNYYHRRLVRLDEESLKLRLIVPERKSVEDPIQISEQLKPELDRFNKKPSSQIAPEYAATWSRLIALDFRNFHLISSRDLSETYSECQTSSTCELEVYLALDSHFRAAWKYLTSVTRPNGTHNMVWKIKVDLYSKKISVLELMYINTDGSNFISDRFQSLGENQGLSIDTSTKFSWPLWGNSYEERKKSVSPQDSRTAWAVRFLKPFLARMLQANRDVIVDEFLKEANADRLDTMPIPHVH